MKKLTRSNISIGKIKARGRSNKTMLPCKVQLLSLSLIKLDECNFYSHENRCIIFFHPHSTQNYNRYGSN